MTKSEKAVRAELLAEVARDPELGTAIAETMKNVFDALEKYHTRISDQQRYRVAALTTQKNVKAPWVTFR